MAGGTNPSAGALIDGRYLLTHRLGEGTFGEVWRAEDNRLSHRAVAIKFLKAEFLAHAEAVARFEAEADALAQVQHPNVVGVHDRGRWGGTHFLVTEFVEGRTLSEWLSAHRVRGVTLEIGAVLTLFDQMCAGIAAGHAVRAPGAIVHRDVKPDNVLVRIQPDGEPLVKIVDFGIAQLGQRTGTRTGAMMGTPLYMAPEQALGNAAAVGPWTDVFALGVVLVEMLTLRAQVDVSEPWWGTAMQRGGDVRALLSALRRDVPSGLWDVVAASLRARGSERPADASVLRTALRGLRSSIPPAPGVAAVPPTMLAATVPPQPGWTPPPVMPVAAVQSPPAGIARTVLSAPPPGVNVTTAPFVRGVPPSRMSRRVPWSAMLAVGTVVLGLTAVVALRYGHSENDAQASAAITTPSTLSGNASRDSTGAGAVESDPALHDFFQRWSRAVLLERGGVPLNDFYADAVQFRRSGRIANAASIALYYTGGAAHGDTFTIDWTRSVWQTEALTSPDATHACTSLPGATGDIVKVRAWATEVSPNRAGTSSGDVPCDRLDGVYLFRLRRVAGALRICHETWSLREGVCASCPTAPPCQTLVANAPPAPTGCIYNSHSVFHLRTDPVMSRDGAEEITTNPRIAVLRAGSLRRGSEGMFYVRFLDGTNREGWVFIPLNELGPGCPVM